jgi:MinD-like ATPase involved in chromosome partitioning or flagellar assembly
MIITIDGVGKTTIAVNLAIASRPGRIVMFFSSDCPVISIDNNLNLY